MRAEHPWQCAGEGKAMSTWKRGAWKAVRRGDIYCAPACGHKCTWQEYQTAKLKARALADRLGSGFKPFVHENLGWHYRAVSKDGRIEVFENDRRAYSACIAPGSFWHNASTPKAAVAKVVAAVRAKAAELLKVVEGL